jgi:hypothetical protein
MSRLPLGFVPEFLMKLSSLQPGSTIMDDDETGEGGSGGGEEYNRECLFDNDCNNVE